MSLQGFEGFEKRLEIEFRAVAVAVAADVPAQGLRRLRLEQLEEILTAAQCTIVSALSTAEFDSYVLSESSLFVYPLRVVIKTCGTTQLLRAVPVLLRHAAPLGLWPRRCRYSRGSFLFPEAQPFPHRSFDEETLYLDRFFKPLACSHSCVLSPDSPTTQWHLYTACDDDTAYKDEAATYTLEVCMTELDRACAAKFFKDLSSSSSAGNSTSTAADMTAASGIDALLPGSQICDFAFEPCGYSMNGVQGAAYSTIHVTPEEGYSYASFEVMGYDPRQLDLPDPLKRVASVFKPASLSFAVHTNDPARPAHSHALHSWLRAATLGGYTCVASNRQELPTGATVAFNTFVKAAKAGSSSKLPVGIAAAATDDENPRLKTGYRLCCGMHAASSRSSLHTDAIIPFSS